MRKEPVSISVIIPAYNSEATIARALNSLKKQTIRPTEIILVDDASQDATVAIAEKWKHNNPQIAISIIKLKDNQGPGTARNLAWNLATQEYIAFLDADDEWAAIKLETQYSVMRSNPEVAISGHDYCYFKPYSETFTAIKLTKVSKFVILLRNQFVTPSIMLKRDVPERFSDESRHMEDHLLWIKIIANHGPGIKINLPLVTLHKGIIGEGGLSGDVNAMRLAELRNIRNLISDKYITAPTGLAMACFSVAKHLRRLFISQISKFF